MSDECPVCRDVFTIKIRRPIDCPRCDFVCCSTCFRKFIMSSATEPACMSCKTQLNYEYIQEQLPGSFWNKEYKEFRKDLLLSREESLLPETQDCVVRIKKAENFYKHIEQLQKKINRLQRVKTRMIRRWNEMNTLIQQDINGEIEIPDDHSFFLYFDDNNDPLVDEKNQLIAMMDDKTNVPEARVRRANNQSTWVHACPMEACRGFLRGEQSRCPICNVEVCVECLRLKEENGHVCNDEDIETVNMLRQNTKPCPQCSIPIYKVSGCDQMWCTQCKTPFSWKTGARINQTIHNPHYYEWMQNRGDREMGREMMDIPCGGLPYVQQLDTFPFPFRDWAYHLHRWVTHTEHVLIPRSQGYCDENGHVKRMRVEYLQNKLTRITWRDELYRREKIRQKHQQYLQILQTFVAVVSDWMRRMIVSRPNDFAHEHAEIRKFLSSIINKNIMQLNHRFKSQLAMLPDVLI